MKTFNVKIKGLTPLIIHRFAENSEVDESTRKVIVRRPEPRQQAASAAHVRPDGTYYFPGVAITRLLAEMGGNHKIRGSRKSAKYSVPGAVLVAEDTVTILNGDNKSPAKSFEVDSRPVVIPATKGRIMRHRPRFDLWSAAFNLRINENILPADFIKQLLDEGGLANGIGDFRPQKGGPFGTFTVIEWKPLEK